MDATNFQRQDEERQRTQREASCPNCGGRIQTRGVPKATGTDANAIQIAREGVAAGLVSIPNRYMHSPVEVVSLKDLDNAA